MNRAHRRAAKRSESRTGIGATDPGVRAGAAGRRVAALGSAAVLASAAGGAAVVLSSASAGANPTIVVDSLDDTILTDGVTTLREAIIEADSAGGKDVITFSVTGTITLTNNLPTVSEAVDITGPGAASLTIDGSGNFSAFYFGAITAASGTSSLTGVTITDAYTASTGAAVRWQNSDADFTLADVVLTGNHSLSNGGAINIFYNTGSVTLSNVVATDNSSGLNGGALYVDAYDGSLTDVTITHSTFTGNQSNGRTGGGAMVVNTADLTMTDTEVSANSASYVSSAGGGGIVFGSGTIAVVTGSTIDDNEVVGANAHGGGVFVGSGAVQILASSVSGNSVANGGGGAIWTEGASSLYVGSSTLAGNTAGYYGGALYLANTGGTLVVNSTISGNTAGQAGAIFVGPSEGLAVLQSTITGNTATAPGLLPAVDGIQVGGGAGACDVASCVATVPVGTVYLAGSILAGNGDLDLGSLRGGAVAAFSEGSIIGTVQTGVVTITDFGHTQVGVTAAALKLGPLADNGGPTLTHALLAGSPAIDAGPTPPITFPGDAWDQRGEGYARVENGRVDVGAFEGQIDDPEPVPEPTFTG